MRRLTTGCILRSASLGDLIIVQTEYTYVNQDSYDVTRQCNFKRPLSNRQSTADQKYHRLYLTRLIHIRDFYKYTVIPARWEGEIGGQQI